MPVCDYHINVSHPWLDSYILIYKVWPEFAELLDTRPITIHEFHSTGMDSLNKTFLRVYLN